MFTSLPQAILLIASKQNNIGMTVSLFPNSFELNPRMVSDDSASFT